MEISGLPRGLFLPMGSPVGRFTASFQRVGARVSSTLILESRTNANDVFETEKTVGKGREKIVESTLEDPYEISQKFSPKYKMLEYSMGEIQDVVLPIGMIST